MKNKISFILIIVIILLFNSYCFADDKIEESMNKETNRVIETTSKITEVPKINSRAAVVIDRDTKEILYGKNENDKKLMASTTKIMTAMTVIQNTNLDNIVEISKKAAATGGSRLKLKAGDKISVKDLLYGLMLRSGNDAAVALAEYVGGNIEEFANLMNLNAESLGLNNTHFITPHGLDSEEHYTTAYELAIITDYALHNQVFSEIVNTKTITININGQSRVINNTNELLGNLNGVYGVKTGFTNGAGRCLVTSIKRDNLDVICIVLGADTKKDRTRDSVRLIEYVFNNYKTISLDKKIDQEFKNWNQINIKRINIDKGESNKLNLVIERESITYPIFKNTEDEIKIKIESNLSLKAPVKARTKIGLIKVLYREKVIKEIDIINTNEIRKKRVNTYISEFISKYNTYFEKVIR